jgi:hypothetical protein
MNFDDLLYRSTPELQVITPYYNPCGYRTRRRNYELFASTLRRSGIPLLTIECAFGRQPFNLEPALNVVHIRSRSLVWQKERLLNLAVSWLPRSVKFVAWIDCDLLFENPEWATETVSALRAYPLVQVFESCNRLPRRNLAGIEKGDICYSFGALAPDDPTLLATGNFEDHGHTGYGWAARRELLDTHKLYEYAIAGSGDHYIAHAALGDVDGPCIRRMMCDNRTLINHFTDWARPFSRSVRGRVGVVAGTVLHLWHGELKHRHYMHRHVQIVKAGFNPSTDIVAAPGKPLEWRPGPTRSKLSRFFAQYFTARREDGTKRGTPTHTHNTRSHSHVNKT